MKIISVHALSLDGAIASNRIESDENRMRYGLTSEEDQLRVEELLKSSDAVITGSSSLISAGKTWEIMNSSGNYVSWYVYSNSGLPDDLKFWDQSNIERTIVSKESLLNKYPENFLNEKTVTNLIYGEEDPSIHLIKHLKEKNAHQVLLFGGGAINKLFFENRLVSNLEYTICPVVLGGSTRVNLVEAGVGKPNTAKLVHTKVANDHVFLSYELNNVNSLIK
jgi:riboflavin biosynthesis pyrimidine reductase